MFTSRLCVKVVRRLDQPETGIHAGEAMGTRCVLKHGVFNFCSSFYLVIICKISNYSMKKPYVASLCRIRFTIQNCGNLPDRSLR